MSSFITFEESRTTTEAIIQCIDTTTDNRLTFKINLTTGESLGKYEQQSADGYTSFDLFIDKNFSQKRADIQQAIDNYLMQSIQTETLTERMISVTPSSPETISDTTHTEELTSEELQEQLAAEEQIMQENFDEALAAQLRIETADDTEHTKNLCESLSLSYDTFLSFKEKHATNWQADAHHFNQTVVRPIKDSALAAFNMSAPLKEKWDQFNQDRASKLNELKEFFTKHPYYAHNPRYKTGVDNCFGPYLIQNMEVAETGGVSLQDTLLRLYVLLTFIEEEQNTVFNETTSFAYSVAQIDDQATTCFQGAISRIFTAYWFALRDYYRTLGFTL